MYSVVWKNLQDIFCNIQSSTLPLSVKTKTIIIIRQNLQKQNKKFQLYSYSTLCKFERYSFYQNTIEHSKSEREKEKERKSLFEIIVIIIHILKFLSMLNPCVILSSLLFNTTTRIGWYKIKGPTWPHQICRMGICGKFLSVCLCYFP